MTYAFDAVTREIRIPIPIQNGNVGISYDDVSVASIEFDTATFEIPTELREQRRMREVTQRLSEYVDAQIRLQASTSLYYNEQQVREIYQSSTTETFVGSTDELPEIDLSHIYNDGKSLCKNKVNWSKKFKNG